MAAKIHYYDIGDYLSREDKLKTIERFGSIESIPWTIIAPNEHGDWLNKRSELFKLYTPLEPEKKFGKSNKAFFNGYSLGLGTNRDAWVYNSSNTVLHRNVGATVSFYNQQVDNYDTKISADEFLRDKRDSTKIVWTDTLVRDLQKRIKYNIDETRFTIGLYRPYFKQNLYQTRILNHRVYQIPKLFPTTKHKNLVICVSGVGASKDFSTLITDCIPDLQLQFNGQCFSLHWYDDSTADIADLFSASQNEENRYVRRDGITDWILSTARKQYGSKIGKEDIFYYVYGILHSPEYRTAFASDLKKSLPRLPLVDSADDFWAFSKAGRALAELHLNYETVEPYKGCLLMYGANTNRGDGMNYRVEKMRFGKLDSKTSDKTKIHYNQHITVEGIPLEAYDYVVNGKSAIEWIMERYAVTVNKDSGIRNDPNDWAAEHNDEKYILHLLLRIITVSLETMKIVFTLPKLKLEE